MADQSNTFSQLAQLLVGGGASTAVRAVMSHVLTEPRKLDYLAWQMWSKEDESGKDWSSLRPADKAIWRLRARGCVEALIDMVVQGGGGR